MYRAVLLPEDQRDFYKFLWREDSTQPIPDYRMTRLTFGVCASSFAANMALKQNAKDHQQEYLQASKAASEDFYVDDGLTREDTVDKATNLQRDMQSLSALGCFRLKKWKASDRTVEQNIEQDLCDQQPLRLINHSENLTKVLSLVWNMKKAIK